MPRKTRKPRKAAAKPHTDTLRRQASRKPVADDAKPQTGLDRHRRIDVRPPKFPGRLGGR